MKRLFKSYKAAKDADPEVAETLAKKLKRIGVDRIIGHADEATVGPHFDPKSNTLRVSKDDFGVLAHEIGHAKNFATSKKLFGKAGQKLHHILYGTSKVGSSAAASIAALSALFGAEDDTVRNIGIAGSAAAAPMLAEELIASTRGANMLRKLKLPGKLKAFSGIPSYLAAAALPMTPWLGMKAYDKIAED
jgi:Zn-dependent membrane protease YugP